MKCNGDFGNSMMVRWVLVVFLLLLLMARTLGLVSHILSNEGWLNVVRCLADRSEMFEFPGQCADSRLIALATEYFEAGENLDSANASAVAGLGWTNMWIGDHNALVRARKAVVQRGNVTDWLFVALLYEQEGRHDLALQMWRAARAAQYYHAKARGLEALGYNGAALTFYHLAVEINPYSMDSFLRIGILQYSQRDYARAIETLEHVLSDANDNREAYAWLGRAYQATGDLDRAMKAYERAASLGELWYGYVALGRLYYQQGDYDMARDWYLVAKDAFSNVLSLNIYLGDTALAMRQYEESRRYYLEALSRGVRSPDLYYSMGRWFYAQGGFHLATEWFEEALQRGLQPDYWFFKAYADSYGRVGNCQRAVQGYRSALEFAPANSAERAYVGEQLQRLHQICQDRQVED